MLEPEAWPLMADAGQGPEGQAETSELMGCDHGFNRRLLDRTTSARFSLRSRSNGVPLDVLADRLSTTRGALYKTLHDARRKLRADLAKRGFSARLDLAETIMDRLTNDNTLKRLPGPGRAGASLR